MACAVLEYGEGSPETATPGHSRSEEFSSQQSPEARFLAVELVKNTCGARGGVGF